MVLGTRHLVIRWQLIAASAILMLLGLGYLAYAFDLWLAERMSVTVAAAVTAGALIVMALIILGISSLLGTTPARSPERGGRLDASDIGDIAVTLVEVGQKLNLEMKSSAKPLALAALAAGCIIGYSPSLQKHIAKILR